MATRKLGMAAMGLLAVMVMLGTLLIVPGCNGVMMNAEYSRLLDQTADLSAETADRAAKGTLPAADMRDALIYQAYVWQEFCDARDGVESGPAPAAPTTQPASLLELAPGPGTQPADR